MKQDEEKIELILDKIPSTAEGLRDALFDEINYLRKGGKNINRSRVIAQLAHRIIEAARLSIHVNGRLKSTETTLLGTK